MRFTDHKGREWTLTRTQALYLAEGDRRRLRYGWGGLRSTLTVRLLEERGLITLRREWGETGWEITGLTHDGQKLLARWNAKHNPTPEPTPEEAMPTDTDPRAIAHSARTTRGVLFDIMVARTSPQDARTLRGVFDVCHDGQLVPDWPGRVTGDHNRSAAFADALVGLVAADVASYEDGRYAPSSDRHVRLREFAAAAGPAGFRQEQVAEDPVWAGHLPELNTALQLARECGAIIRPHPRGRYYAIGHAPTEYVDVVVSWSPQSQHVPLVEADDHR